MERTVSDAVVERLLEWGVDTIFGLPGDGINGFMEALRRARDRIRYVHVRHEEVAAMAAVGYAKFTGRIGVCFSTAAPGAIHLLNGLYDAAMDQAPVLAITGMTYHDLIGTGYLQDMNQDYLFNDVCAFNQRLMGPAHVDNVVDLACRTALAKRQPTHVCIPIDIQAMAASEERRFKRNVPGHTTADFHASDRVPDRRTLEKAVDVLRGKRRIAMLVGSGARDARAEVDELADRLAAQVAKAMLGKDVLPDDSPFTTGSIGVVGTRPSEHVMEQCDALVIVGSTMPYIEHLPKPGQAAGIQIDDKGERIGLRYPVEVGLVGDAKATIRTWLGLLPRNEDRSFLQSAQREMREWWSLMEERATRGEKPMKPQVVSWNLASLLADDAILCGDSGTCVTHLGRMRLTGHQRFSFSGTLCSMAAGLPYAIGAQVAYPKRQVVAFVGDGALSMQMGDLVTLCQHGLPVKIVVLRNDTLGLIQWEQMLFLGNPEYGVKLAPIDFVKVAEACGMTALRIDHPKRCRDGLKELLATPGPALAECVVDPLDAPMPPEITEDEAKKFAKALARGEEQRTRIGLTMGRQLVSEAFEPQSPLGVLGRAAKKLHLSRKGHGGDGHAGSSGRHD